MTAARSVRITHPEKIYWPEEGYTKGDLIAFYDGIFPRLRPWVQGRLLVLERCPEGLRGTCFYQKEAPKNLPAVTKTAAIQHEQRVTNYVVGGAAATQRALVNLGTIAVHVWNARARAPRRPDWMSFDLDPGRGGFADAARAAGWMRELLDELGLESFVKTSGGKGLHIFVPLRPGPDVDVVLATARRICALAARAHPRHLTVETRKDARRGRVYLDAMRNAFAQTVAAPYSVRYRPHAPVSTPLAWREVRPDLDPADFNIGNFARTRRADPWAAFFARRQGLGRALQVLAALESGGREARRN
jgi:bifunctional non-homologous end joining protein LigD